MNEELIKNNILTFMAYNFVGIKEDKNNTGQMIERFQKAVDGKAVGEPWCMSFVQYLIDFTDNMYDAIMMSSSENRSLIYKTEHCMTCFNKTDKMQRLLLPDTGALILWSYYKNGKETGSGHVGIIVDVLDNHVVKTVEGNTSDPDNKIVREGEGVYLKTRDLRYDYGSMRLKGMLRVW